MNVNLLIDAITRQTMVLVAQLATQHGARAQLASVANQVFLDLVAELKNQGLGRKVIADMFGLSLRTYHDKVQRLSESATERGRSLWEAVLSYLEERQVASRAEVLQRFCRDDEASVRGVLRDLVETGLVFQTGRGDATGYRVASAEELGALGRKADPEAETAFLWVQVHHHAPIGRPALREIVRMDGAQFDAAIDRLVADGRVTESDGLLRVDACVIPLGSAFGWEAAIFDHYQAVVTLITNKLQRRERRALPGDAIGGSTFRYDVWHGHPLEEEVSGFLRRVREEGTRLRERVEAHGKQETGSNYQVVFYVGQTVREDEEVGE
ncbi:hypothetical protein [Vulgatibacter sp.]|uniref:hypothetical protein n=1 Tax=Vulgatibacter sp. TaxID=1971226 RepID=UPI00356419A4